MKRYILGILSLVLLSACNSFDESTIESEGNNESNTVTTEEVVISANIKGVNETRVALTQSTNAEGKPFVKVNWEESGEKFLVYNELFWQDGNFSEIDNPNEFQQISGNQFRGFLPTGYYYSATYNCPLKGKQRSALRYSYDISQQDGTLNDKNVLMTSRSSTNPLTFDFDHLTFILKPTFKFRSAGDSTPKDMDTLITRIEMGNAKYVKTDTDRVESTDFYNSQTVTVTPTKQDDIYIFLPKLILFPENDNNGYEVKYNAGDTFTFNVTTSDGKEYTAKPLTLPASPTLEAGKFYTATINLTETRCYLPKGTVFKEKLVDYVNKYMQEHPDSGVNCIKFIARSHQKGTEIKGSDDSPVSGSPAYFMMHGDTVKIHSAAEKFVFNSDCSNMFSRSSDSYKLLGNITSIDFAGCCDTSNVKNMQQMFLYCYNLYGISNANFDTSNVENMYQMFYSCGTSRGPFDELINMSTFDTSNVTNMKEMFGLYYGRKLDVSSFDMSKVTNAINMFEGALYLKELKLGNFNININDCDLGNMLSRVGDGLTNNNKTNIYVSSQDIIDRLTNQSSGTGVTIKNNVITPSHIIFVLPTQAN